MVNQAVKNSCPTEIMENCKAIEEKYGFVCKFQSKNVPLAG